MDKYWLQTLTTSLKIQFIESWNTTRDVIHCYFTSVMKWWIHNRSGNCLHYPNWRAGCDTQSVKKKEEKSFPRRWADNSKDKTWLDIFPIEYIKAHIWTTKKCIPWPNQNNMVPSRKSWIKMVYRCCLVAQSCPTLLWPPWTVALQVPLFMGFPRQDYWSELPFLWGSFRLVTINDALAISLVLRKLYPMLPHFTCQVWKIIFLKKGRTFTHAHRGCAEHSYFWCCCNY